MLLKIKQAKEEKENEKKKKPELKLKPKTEIKKDTEGKRAETNQAEESKTSTCHTAVKGEPCYNSVLWVKTTGLKDHPNWFKTLDHTSTFEDIQTHIYKDPKAKTLPKTMPSAN